MQKPHAPSPFQFTGTREYLNAAYTFHKARWSGFSHRYIAQKVDVSVAFFSRLLKGDLRLRPDKVDVFAKLFELNPKECEYLHQLVICERSEGEEQTMHFRKLLELRGITLSRLTEDSFGFYSNWYIPVLRELLAIVPLDWSDSQIGQILKPSLSPETVAEARDLLIKLGLLRLDGRKLCRTDLLVSSGDDPVLALRHFADECLALARRALVEEPMESRELSFLSLSISNSTKEQIVAKIRNLRRELLDLAAMDLNPDQVIQVQLHYFPQCTPISTIPEGQK